MKGVAGEVVLGRYRLEHPVGEGGFGCVWRGRQLALDRPVAVKATRAARKDDDGLAERFRREALLVAGIVHANVVTYHDFGIDDDGDRVLVMELLQGMTLLDVLRRGRPVPLSDVARWIGEAAAGLSEAHARGLVHRDVKPSNLFLAAPGTRAERLKVIDFGIVRADPRAHPGLAPLTRTDAVIGTPEYIAPEALLGNPQDGRADQYALALVAYELLAQRRPFPPADRGGLAERMSRRPEGLDFAGAGRRVPPAVTAALWRALSPAPADRFPTILAFADALAAGAAEAGGEGTDPRTRLEAAGPGEGTRTLETRVEGLPAAGADRPAGRGRGVRGALVLAGMAALALGAGGALAWRQAGSGGRPGNPATASGAGVLPGPADAAGGLPGTAGDPAEGGTVPAAAGAVPAATEGAGVATDGAAAATDGAAEAGSGPETVVGPGRREGPAEGSVAPRASARSTGTARADGRGFPGTSARVPGRAAPDSATRGNAVDPGSSDVRGMAASASSTGVRETAAAVPAPAPREAPAQTPAPGSGAPGGHARLILNAYPYAEVLVDGRPVGRTPLRDVRVAPGRHEVVFRNPLKGEAVQVVEVGPGEERRLPTAFREGGVSPGAAP